MNESLSQVTIENVQQVMGDFVITGVVTLIGIAIGAFVGSAFGKIGAFVGGAFVGIIAFIFILISLGQ